ncbi:MAG TPA: response regulator transcription factor [Actinomycetota bacterium]|nr:response regulator transcription factor [Actinomycetota bacterium]
MTTTIRILLVDGSSLFRQAVSGALNRVDGLEVIAESQTASLAVSDAERTQPDLAVVDGDFFVSWLPAFIADLRAASPTCKVLVLTSEEELAPLIDALRAGASGYLTKETSLDELVDAAKAVAKGEVVVPPQMLGELLTTLVQQGGKKTDDSIMTLSKLTRRERQVLALLADGSDKDAIAVALAISPQTARTHVQNILAKLGLHSRLEAAAFARKHPILKQFVASDR